MLMYGLAQNTAALSVHDTYRGEVCEVGIVKVFIEFDNSLI